MRKCSYCGTEYSDDVAVCALDQTSLDIQASSSFSFPWAALFSWSGLLFNIYVNLCIIYGSLPEFYSHQNIGPGIMIGFIGLFFTAVICFLVGIPCAILAIKKGRRRVGWLGVAFALTPAPLALALLKAAMQINGLHFD
jgi:hypothetical protein